jgi:hypothetical protein
LDYKYRTRTVSYKKEKQKSDNVNKKTLTEYRTPIRRENDLIFAVHKDNKSNLQAMYFDLVKSFGKTLDRMGKGAREDGNERRRQITLHSFRRFVKLLYLTLVMLTILNISLGILALHTGAKRIQRRLRHFARLNPILHF